MNKPSVIAVDMGESKLLVGELDFAGNILACKQYESLFDNQDAALRQIILSLDDYRRTVPRLGRLRALGVGLVGKVDHLRGLWRGMLPGDDGMLPVMTLLSERYDLPVGIENDVRAAALGEWKIGAGRHYRDMVFINVGTGVACSVVNNNELVNGANWQAGEIGHMVVDMNSDVVCRCGKRGCVEALASGYGVYRRIETLRSRYPASPLSQMGGQMISTEMLNYYRNKGDPLAKRLTDDAVDALAAATMNMVQVCDPEVIIYGGGIMYDGTVLEMIQARMTADVLRSVKGGLRMSQFGADRAGLVGASAVAQRAYECL